MIEILFTVSSLTTVASAFAIVYLTVRLKQQKRATLEAAKLSSLGEMASGIAHEINNPLAIIISTSKYLEMRERDGELSPEMLRQGLSDIDSTVKRISRIVRGMRILSRSTAEEGREEVCMKEILEDVFSVCTDKFRSHEIDLRLEDPKKISELRINCYRVQLSQVLLNLLTNAFDAISSEDERWIRVSLEEGHESVVIKVVDSGQGVSEEIAQKIFLPFFTTKEVGKGTGLGLSLSRSIIERHGGLLYLDGRESHTCFAIELPQKKSPSP